MITVLLIEDSPGDARLIIELLGEADGGDFHVCHADCLSAGLRRLTGGSEEGIDVILLDLTLPDSIGLDTFASVYAQASWLPIVVLTGLEDEELAARAIRAGAQDYLGKGEMGTSLLARSLRYAIERKRAEEERERLMHELQEANQLLAASNLLAREMAEAAERRAAELKAIINSVTDGIVTYLPNGRVELANAAANRMFGKPIDEHRRLSIEDWDRELGLHNADGSPVGRENLPSQRALRGETVIGVPMIIRRPDGTETWVSASAAPIRSPGGELLGGGKLIH